MSAWWEMKGPGDFDPPDDDDYEWEPQDDEEPDDYDPREGEEW